jgi:hypothetical protein
VHCGGIFDSGCSAFAAKCSFVKRQSSRVNVAFLYFFSLEFGKDAVSIFGPFSGPDFGTVRNPTEVVLQVGWRRISWLVCALAGPKLGPFSGPSFGAAKRHFLLSL